jgi:hypothetical protein
LSRSWSSNLALTNNIGGNNDSSNPVSVRVCVLYDRNVYLLAGSASSSFLHPLQPCECWIGVLGADGDY